MRSSDGPAPLLISLETIGTCNGAHSDSDLIFFRNTYICVFRDQEKSNDENGYLNVMISTNGVIWSHSAILDIEGWDLDHPKLFITSDGQLHLLAQGLRDDASSKRQFATTFFAVSQDGNTFSRLLPLHLNGEHLFRLTWHQGTGYGYSYSDRLKLVSTVDGIDFQLLSEITPQLQAKEGVLHFLPEDHLVCLVSDQGLSGKTSWIGSSFPPFIDWLWSETVYGIRGANFLPISDKLMIAVGNIGAISPYGSFSKTALFSMTLHRLDPLVVLPGFSHGSPGLIFKDDHLLVSYDSVAEKATTIHIAKFLINSLNV